MANTPNMDLNLPVVSLTLGPQWASELNAALELVDSHDHTTNNGVRIPTAGIQLNADLTFNSFAATELDRTSYTDQIAALTDLRSIYTVNGDLYYTNTAGDQVKITAGNALNSTPGAISGLGDGGSSGVYYNDTDTLSFYYESTAQAKLDISTVQIHPYEVGPGPSFTPVAHPEYIALTAPTSLAASYDLTLPAATPSRTLPLTVDVTGQMIYGFAAGTAADPSLAFTGDLNTGIYNSAADNLAITTGGTARFTVGTSGITNTLPLYSPIGSAGTPTYSFAGDLNTGIYASNADEMSFSTGGTSRLTVNTSTFTVGLPMVGQSTITAQGVIQAPNGSGSAPSYTFTSDPDTGLYRQGLNSFGLTAGGTVQLTAVPGGMTAFTPFVVNSSITASSTIQASGGMRSGTSGDTVKWEVFTGSVGGLVGTTLTVSGTVTGAIGMSSSAGSGSNFMVMGYGTGPISSTINFSALSTASNEVRIVNSSGSTNTYKVTVFYI